MMASKAVANLIPEGRQQDPLPAGNIGRVILSRVGVTPTSQGSEQK
jgi:hypothetical protein